MKNVPIKGIIPPIVTPMSADESVNIPELRNQIERQIAGGVHGIFPFGTNGEGYILSMKEKEEVLEATIDQVKGRIPVYAGTGCISTRDTIYMSKRAEEMGADVLSIITPSFALASQKELYDHYCEVAKHVSIPIVLYNIPARTGNKLLPETVGKLALTGVGVCLPIIMVISAFAALMAFGGAPRADETSSHGHNTFVRTRNLDVMPFGQRLRFDLEMLSWNPGAVDYRAAAFWYGTTTSAATEKN